MTFRRQSSKMLFESPSVASGEEPELKRLDFDFERKLGDGAFGQVWRVRHKQTSQLFALKQVPKEKVSKMLPQFRREVYIMYEINHPHVIKLFNHFEDDKYFYLIMELAEGNLFHKLYREKHFLERVAAQFFREVLLAVEYLHSHVPSIIHRDIKPENILLDKEGRLKLTDFGWSNYYSTDAPTPRFTTCGTLEYLPPEMVQEKGHDTSADIWCLGILLYEMLIGGTPFKSTLREQMMMNITNSKPKFPLSMPQLAKDLISKMLEKDPAKRPTAIKIKEHQWMVEHAPIRPTITQELVPKVIPEFESPKGVTGYLVINKDIESPNKELSATRLSTEVPLLPNNYRQSIKQIKDDLEVRSQESIGFRKNIQEKASTIQKTEEEVKQIETKISKKQKELSALVMVEKDIGLQIADITFDLEKLLKYYKNNDIASKISSNSLHFMEMSSECKRQFNYLQTLREDLKNSSQDLTDKEKALNSLHLQLKSLKVEAISKIDEEKTRLADKMISQEVLMFRLNNRDKFSKELGKEEKKIAEDIKKSIMQLINVPDTLRKLEEDILSMKVKVIEKEQELSNLCYFYEERRSEIIQKHRVSKEEVSKRLKLLRETQEAKENQKGLSAAEDLRIEINNIRKAALEFSVSDAEIQKQKAVWNNLLAKLQSINVNIEDEQAVRSNNKLKRMVNKEQIEGIEMQIGILKSALLFKSQYSDSL